MLFYILSYTNMIIWIQYEKQQKVSDRFDSEKMSSLIFVIFFKFVLTCIWVLFLCWCACFRYASCDRLSNHTSARFDCISSKKIRNQYHENQHSGHQSCCCWSLILNVEFDMGNIYSATDSDNQHCDSTEKSSKILSEWGKLCTIWY